MSLPPDSITGPGERAAGGRRPLRHSFRTLLRRLLFLAGLVAVAALAWRVRHELAAGLRGLDAATLTLSLVLGVASAVFQAGLFGELLAAHAPGVPARLGARAQLLTQLAKYIPGKVWQLVHQAAATPDAATPGRLILANADLWVLVFSQLVTVAGAALLGPGAAALGALVAGTVLGALVARQRWAGRILHALARRLRFDVAATGPTPPATTRLLLLNAGCVATNFAASLLLLRALLPDQPDAAWRTLGAYGFATALGSLIVVLPAGVGAREYLAIALGGLVAAPLSPRAMGSLALLVRCWQVAIDLGGIAVGAALAARERRGTAPADDPPADDPIAG